MNSVINCKCKICRQNLSDVVNKKVIDDNIGILDIKKYLFKQHNLEVSDNVIKRHLKNHNIELNKDNCDVKTVNPTEILTSASDGVINKYNEILIDLNDINLDKYDFDKNDLTSVVSYVQKIQIGLYLKQAEIVFKELSEYQNGYRENYPNVAINNLKKLFELLERISGFRYSVDLNAAMDKLISYGYSISENIRINDDKKD